MYRRSFVFLFTTHSVRAVPFQIGINQAKESIVAKYNSRWFGPSAQYIHFTKSTAEYIPFFLCKGEMRGVYTASVSYTEKDVDSSGKARTTTRTHQTSPQNFESSFNPNHTQIYAGYKFSNRQVMKVIRDPEAPLLMKKVHDVDTSHANINLFEMSTTTLSVTAKSVAMQLAEEEARQYVKGFHPSAESIRIDWVKFEMELDEVYPCYLPAVVSEIEYDKELFTIYTSGRTANSTGPYLLSGVALSRVAAVTTVGLATLLAPSKFMGLFLGSLAAMPASLVAAYFAKQYPIYIRNRNRKEREKRQKAQSEADSTGFKPNTESQRRVFGEKKYSQEKAAKYGAKKRQDGRVVKDVCGYYEILRLSPDASIEDIRQNFRQLAIQHHPDAGGDVEKMKSINEAYRVLRSPEQREAYDRR